MESGWRIPTTGLKSANLGNSFLYKSNYEDEESSNGQFIALYGLNRKWSAGLLKQKYKKKVSFRFNMCRAFYPLLKQILNPCRQHHYVLSYSYKVEGRECGQCPLLLPANKQQTKQNILLYDLLF